MDERIRPVTAGTNRDRRGQGVSSPRIRLPPSIGHGGETFCFRLTAVRRRRNRTGVSLGGGAVASVLRKVRRLRLSGSRLRRKISRSRSLRAGHLLKPERSVWEEVLTRAQSRRSIPAFERRSLLSVPSISFLVNRRYCSGGGGKRVQRELSGSRRPGQSGSLTLALWGETVVSALVSTRGSAFPSARTTVFHVGNLATVNSGR